MKIQAIFFYAIVLILALTGIFAWHWVEVAKSPFWWNFWAVWRFVAFILAGALVWWINKERKQW